MNEPPPAHLSVLPGPPLGSVLREEVESGAGQQGVLSLLLPQQRHLEADRHSDTFQ